MTATEIMQALDRGLVSKEEAIDMLETERRDSSRIARAAERDERRGDRSWGQRFNDGVDDLIDGWFLMPANKDVYMPAFVTREFADEIQRVADRECGGNRSMALRTLLREALDRRGEIEVQS